VTPDVNVLVAASRADHAHHATASHWLTQALLDSATPSVKSPSLQLMGTVVASYLRLVTHPKIFVEPTPMAQALAFANAVLASPGVGWLPTGTEWAAMHRLCNDLSLSGNHVPDAWIAATTVTHGEVLVTFDRDFVTLLPSDNLLLLPTR
jgi:uncharacterized protein